MQFLVKWIGRSYKETAWISTGELREVENNRVSKAMSFLNNRKNWGRILHFDDPHEPHTLFFDTQYVEIDRLLNVKREVVVTSSAEEGEHTVEITRYLVKWCGLGYSQATWENIESLGLSGDITLSHSLTLSHTQLHLV